MKLKAQPVDKAQPTVLTRGVDLPLGLEEVFHNLHRLPGFFFLDSGSGDHELARFSYVGVQPLLVVRSRGRGVDLVEGKKIEHLSGNPLDILGAQLSQRHLKGGSPLIPFSAGAVGYLSYEFARSTMDVPLSASDDLGLPEMYFAFYRTLLAYEHGARRWIGASADLTGGRGTTVRKRLGNEIDKLVELAQKPHRGTVPVVPAAVPGDEEPPLEEPPPPPAGRRLTIDGVELTSTMSRDEYLDGVRRIKEHIARGDIYQANLTQRWSAPYLGDPGQLYVSLRRASPAPFGLYMNTGECVLAGSSPERFLSVQGRSVETRPIKGTRPRGATPEEDERLRRELLESAKDRAELVMIADLERNDLGRVCEPGSVRVDELPRLETFANVHHLLSVVKGELRPDVGPRDLLEATFPSGSVTGAPKRRAMEILDEVEGTGRGPYTGAMGYVGFDGSMGLNVAIRTLVLSQGMCHMGVGSGIVADSDPEAEYAECQAKARGMLAALREAGAAVPAV